MVSSFDWKSSSKEGGCAFWKAPLEKNQSEIISASDQSAVSSYWWKNSVPPDNHGATAISAALNMVKIEGRVWNQERLRYTLHLERHPLENDVRRKMAPVCAIKMGYRHFTIERCVLPAFPAKQLNTAVYGNGNFFYKTLFWAKDQVRILWAANDIDFNLGKSTVKSASDLSQPLKYRGKNVRGILTKEVMIPRCD